MAAKVNTAAGEPELDLDLDDEELGTDAELPEGQLAKYMLIRPYWDGAQLFPRGEVLEFPEGSEPSGAQLQE